MGWLDSITDSMDMNLSEVWEIAKYREAWCALVQGAAKSQTQLSHRATRRTAAGGLCPAGAVRTRVRGGG